MLYKKLKFYLMFLSLSSLNAIRFEHVHFDAIPSAIDYIRDNVDELFSDPTRQLVITSGEQVYDFLPDEIIHATFGLAIPFEKIEQVEKSPYMAQLIGLSVVQTLKIFF